MNQIWVISETAEEGYQLISKAAELSDNVTAYLNASEEEANLAFRYGADEVIRLLIPEHTLWENAALDLKEKAEEIKPDLILVNATKRGKSLAGYLGGLIEIPVVTEIKTLNVYENKLQLKRTIYGGLAERTVEIEEGPAIVTVASGIFTKKELDSVGGNHSVTVHLINDTEGLVVSGRKAKEKTSVNLADANVVIGVGRGFAKQETIKYAEQLAGILQGEIACSRPVTEDLHWLPEERYIGISGQVIKPDLYLCAGISGQIQHVYGIRDAKTIVAINKDENAPILKVADYFIVGDLNDVLPELIQALKLVTA